MKKIILILAISYFQISLSVAKSILVKDSTIIFIENPNKDMIWFQEEILPQYIIPEFRTTKANDTLKIPNQGSCRLILAYMNERKNTFYKTLHLKPNEQVKIKKIGLDIQIEVISNLERTIELIFFNQLQNETGNFEGNFTYIPHKRKNIDSLFAKVNALYESRISFLKQYKKKHIISANFEAETREILFHRKIIELLDHCNLDEMMDKNILANSQIKELVNTFLKKKVVSENIYQLEVQKWINNLLYLEKDDFKKQYYTLKDSLNGKQIFDYFAIDIFDHCVDQPYFPILFEDYLNTAKAEPLKQFVVSTYGNFYAQDLKFRKPPNKNNVSELIDLKEKKIVTWEDLIKTESPKILFFWATWCTECMESMRKLKNLESKLNKQSIKVIYISIDEKSGVWERISKKEGLPEENSYLMLNPSVSKVKNEFDISILPRYMIVDSFGNITNKFAPNINEPNLKKELNQLLK